MKDLVPDMTFTKKSKKNKEINNLKSVSNGIFFATKIMTRIILIFLLMISFSCQKVNKNKFIDINKEIKSLNSNSDKELYLISIFESDQKIRNEEGSEIYLKHGEGSNELLNYRQKMDSIDNLNFQRIELYLEKFSYPNKDSLSEIAVITPWVVIHHSSLKKRNKKFNKLYEAYKAGNIEASQFQMYLERTYLMKFGIWPKSDEQYRSKDKIHWLIKELKLEIST